MAFNVLVVDDSSSMRTVIKKTLQISGFDAGRIFEAGNGREALAVLDKEWVDIILSDIHMPEMDGTELLKALKKREVAAQIPVVVVTTEGRQDRVKELLALGARAWIKKPFKPEEIKRVLLDLLGVKAQPKADAAPAGGCDF